MKTIKNFMIAAMVMFAGNAMAQKLSAEAVTIEPGGEASLVVSYESEKELTGAQFSVTLPTGVELKEENYEYISTLGADQTGYQVNINDGDGCQIVIISRVSKKAPALVSGKELITLALVADADAKVGEAKATISEIVFSDKGTAVKVDGTVDVAVNITDGTGINSLNADNSNEPAFNLAGQKVGKNYKGIVVKNGKKVAVK